MITYNLFSSAHPAVCRLKAYYTQSLLELPQEATPHNDHIQLTQQRAPTGVELSRILAGMQTGSALHPVPVLELSQEVALCDGHMRQAVHTYCHSTFFPDIVVLVCRLEAHYT